MGLFLTFILISDPFCRVSIGGDVWISGQTRTINEVSRSTRIIKETLNPRWNEVNLAFETLIMMFILIMATPHKGFSLRSTCSDHLTRRRSPLSSRSCWITK